MSALGPLLAVAAAVALVAAMVLLPPGGIADFFDDND